MDPENQLIVTNDNLRALLANGSNGGEIIANRTLRDREWIRYDQELLHITRDKLVIVNDLRNAGLVMNLGNIGVTESRWEKLGNMTAATYNMDGDVPAQNDRVTYDEDAVPIPIIQKNHEIGMRQLAASRTTGASLDITQMTIATRLVVDTLESMVFNGLPNFTVAGRQIYGITTHPKRNTTTLSGGGWTVAANRDIEGDVVAMLNAMYAHNMNGPYNMYVAKDIWGELQRDYSKEKGDRTHKERLEAYAEINKVDRGDSLAPGTVVLIQLTRDVIDLAVSQDIINVEWDMGNPMKTLYKVWCAMAVRVKATKDDQCGICVGSPNG